MNQKDLDLNKCKELSGTGSWPKCKRNKRELWSLTAIWLQKVLWRGVESLWDKLFRAYPLFRVVLTSNDVVSNVSPFKNFYTINSYILISSHCEVQKHWRVNSKHFFNKLIEVCQIFKIFRINGLNFTREHLENFILNFFSSFLVQEKS